MNPTQTRAKAAKGPSNAQMPPVRRHSLTAQVIQTWSFSPVELLLHEHAFHIGMPSSSKSTDYSRMQASVRLIF